MFDLEPSLGDLDCDGAVGASDVLILLANWGPCGDCDDCPADLNGDCTVGADAAAAVAAVAAASGYAPASHAIAIVGDTTQIRYDPPTVVNLFRGDTVLWYLQQPGPFDEFEIDLEEHTPAYQRWIRVSATDTARAVIRLSANGGMYGYSITLRAGVRLFDIHPELKVRTRTNNR